MELEAYPFNAIQFVDYQHYARSAKLDITPTPDVVIRVFMVFRWGIDAHTQLGHILAPFACTCPSRCGFRSSNIPFSFCECGRCLCWNLRTSSWNHPLPTRVFSRNLNRGLRKYDVNMDTAELANLNSPSRQGFVAVEWGGMSLNKDWSRYGLLEALFPEAVTGRGASTTKRRVSNGRKWSTIRSKVPSGAWDALPWA